VGQQGRGHNFNLPPCQSVSLAGSIAKRFIRPPMKPKPASTRLWVLLAREAPVGVIFRRGPSKQVQMIKWNLADDTLEEGQWFKGRIYERRCDLSPDGTFLIYFAATYKKPLESWTAISRPPCFTALALWPKGDGWNGGGYFVGPRDIHLDHPARASVPHPDFAQGALRFHASSLASHRGEDTPVWNVTRDRAGWKMVEQGKWNKYGEVKGFFLAAKVPETWRKRRPLLPLELAMEIHAIHQKDGPWYVTRYCVFLDSNTPCNDLGFADWAEWDADGDLLFARDGCLYRQRFARGKWRPSKLLADLTGNKFRNVPAPAWATEF